MIYHVDTRGHTLAEFSDWIGLRHMQGERLWIMDARTAVPKSSGWSFVALRGVGFRYSRVTQKNTRARLRMALSKGCRPVVLGDNAEHRAAVMSAAPVPCRRRAVWTDLRESRGQ